MNFSPLCVHSCVHSCVQSCLCGWYVFIVSMCPSMCPCVNSCVFVSINVSIHVPIHVSFHMKLMCPSVHVPIFVSIHVFVPFMYHPFLRCQPLIYFKNNKQSLLSLICYLSISKTLWIQLVPKNETESLDTLLENGVVLEPVVTISNSSWTQDLPQPNIKVSCYVLCYKKIISI